MKRFRTTMLSGLLMTGSLFAGAVEPGPGHCLVFSGRDAVATVPHREALNAYPLTVTLWMKSTQSDGAAGLVTKYVSGAHSGWQLYLRNGNLRAWYLVNYTNSVWDGADGMDGGRVTDGQWHHLAFTVGADGGRLYVDGILRDARSWTGPAGATTAQHPLTLGEYPGTGPSFFRGQMDEVSIWNRRLGSPEIADRRFRSLRGDESGLIAYYRFDSGAGSVVVDSAHPLEVGTPAPGELTGSFAWTRSGAPLLPEDPAEGLPRVVRQPAGPEVEAGLDLSLEAVMDDGDWTYQWTRDGVEIPGALERLLRFEAVGSGHSGEYRVVVRRGAETRTSLPTAVRVITRPQWVSGPVAAVVDPGGATGLQARALGGRPMSWEWFRNGTRAATLAAPGLSLDPVRFQDSGTWQAVVRNAFGSLTSAPVRVRVVATALTHDLVVHLPFDGDFQDRSGRGNHARYATNGPNARPTPTFAPGLLGTAFEYTTRGNGTAFEYATLGYPEDLRWDGTQDFSVSFWTSFQTQEGDLPFLSNKDWFRSHNAGWAISMQGAGTFRVNLTGPRHGADMFTTARTPLLRGGRWRHVLVSVQRALPGERAWVILYVDGAEVNRTPLYVEGTVDTADLPFQHSSPRSTRQPGWAVNIGQDGTGVYFDQGGASALGARMDDLGIWRRALTAFEASAIFQAGRDGLNLAQARIAPQLFIVTDRGQAELFWPGDPTVRLETRGSLDGSPWMDLDPGTASASNPRTVDLTEPAALFRLTELP
ncbi:MAG: hypothetical protein J0L84_12170 [Verrucomicrobia bacterium]|nr:hypothetical protein [Verrucomicrobiota bacterium]